MRGRLLGRSPPAAIVAVAAPLDRMRPAAARAAIESFLGPEAAWCPPAYLAALAKAGG